MKRTPLLFAAALALPAAAQQSLPAPEQHVTVPSAPGQSNKETVVQPTGTLKQGSYGWVLQGDRATRSGSRRAAVRSTGANAPPDPGAYSPTAALGPAVPAGPAVVGAAYVTVRGTMKTYTKNAITILEKSGRERKVPLAPRALVYEGLKPGDEVVLRIPFDEGADCRTADRVERPPAPRAPPKSKFSQAQSTGS
jgi:hypothetical protein